MAVHVNKLIEALAIISEDQDLKVIVSETLKGGLMTGISTILGGLLFGPVGLALGGAVGGTVSAFSSSGKFQPLGVFIRNMPFKKKQLLCQKIKQAFQDFGIADVSTIATLILSQQNFQELAVREAVNFLRSNMGLSISS